MDTKTCPCCTTSKPVGDFAANARRADGLQTYCRVCQAAKRAAWFEKNKESERQYNRERHARERAERAAAAGGTTVYTSTVIPRAATPTRGEGGEPIKDRGTFEQAFHDTYEKKRTPAAEKNDQPPTADGNDARVPRESVPSTDVTTMPTTGFADLPHAAIVRSKTNPRTRFDHDKLVDLAADIQANGILQPLLVRPLPGARLQETLEDLQPGQMRPTHELIAGERRWRAAGMAGLKTLPVLVRALTDDQVMTAQLVENLQREDLHPMEEAEGYERMHAAGMTAEQIGDRIGRSRAHVYTTMSLLRLIPEARTAFFDKRLTRATAELVARYTETLQPAILKDLTAVDHLGEPMSVRRAREHLENNYMLRLATAVFEPTDPLLVPAAGPCTTCPMRSGANPQLFEDVANADTCTNPPCFATKKAAHYERITARAAEQGQTAIVGKEAREIVGPGGALRGYTRVDSNEATGKNMRSLRETLGEKMPTPTLLEDPATHKMIEVLPTAEASKLLRERNAPAAAPEPAAAADVQATYEQRWRRRALEELYAATASDKVGVATLRAAAELLLEELKRPALEVVAQVLKVGSVAMRDGVLDLIRTSKTKPSPAGLLRILIMAHDLQAPGAEPLGLQAVASDTGVDMLTPIRDAVKAELKEATAAPAPAPAAPTKPGRKPKLGVDEFNAELAKRLGADAPSPNGFAENDRVRLRTDVTAGLDTYHLKGKEATVVEEVDASYWRVEPDGMSMSFTVHYTALEAV